MANIKSVCIFCGSRSGKNKAHTLQAQELGAGLAKLGFRIIYGGGQVGLMGDMAKAALAENAHITGIIPSFLNKREVRFDAVTEVVQTETLRERIKLMAERSDAFVVLPGGVGTLDEFMQMLTMNILREHNKPIILIDYEGFWQPFMQMLDSMEEMSFLYPQTIEKLTLVPNTEAAISELSALNG